MEPAFAQRQFYRGRFHLVHHWGPPEAERDPGAPWTVPKVAWIDRPTGHEARHSPAIELSAGSPGCWLRSSPPR